MKTRVTLILAAVLGCWLLSASAFAATEQAKQQAIDDGLAWLASTQTTSGSEGYWSYSNDGTLAATGSAALAFIEEGYLPGNNVVIGGNNYGDVVGKAVNYIFNRATADTRFSNGGRETAGYTRIAEDYNNDGNWDTTEGNNQALYFNPGSSNRNVYTTGIVAPVVYALGEALGKNTTVGRGSVTSSMTYGQVMQDVVDWFSWGQVEPSQGNYRGGWRYDANFSTSDQSTAQWGALPMLYADAWGLGRPEYVNNELKLWVDYTQNDNGGVGYENDSRYVNVSKTGGALIEMKAMGWSEGVNNSNTSDNSIVNEVDAALDYINSRWNVAPYGTWYGNLNHPYAMWAVYKALQVYGKLSTHDNGTPGDPTDDFLVGFGIPNAPGGYIIGQEWNTTHIFSQAGDWFSHYCDLLVGLQNSDGFWTGYTNNWTGALATGWYVNILNAAGAPPSGDEPIPEPGTLILFGTGLLGLGFLARKRRFI